MRFGGNIGVHAINRTSAAPMNPSQQLLQPPGALGMPGMGGLGAMAGLSSALDGLPGAPRPGVRPPNWQRAQALAQQAAQAQAQQQVGLQLPSECMVCQWASSCLSAPLDPSMTIGHVPCMPHLS